jgi:ribonuclease HII
MEESPRTAKLRMPGRLLVGVDETGRGSCFGPVITCAACFLPGGLDEDLRAMLADSKALSARQRRRVVQTSTDRARHAFGAASAREVDTLNPLRATMLAMSRAILRLQAGTEAYVVVDGPYMPSTLHEGQAMVRADAQVEEVMLASILAKEFRDALVSRLACRHPGYGLERHAGYGTAAHFAAISDLGPTRHHRETFLRKARQRASHAESIRQMEKA